MIGVDTNILIRFFVDDDPAQNAAARRVLSDRSADDPIFVSAVTLAETIWVLTKTLGYSVQEASGILRDLLASDSVVLEFADELGMILGRSGTPSADLADYLIAWSGAAAGCSRTITFDRRAAKTVPGMELIS